MDKFNEILNIELPQLDVKTAITILLMSLGVVFLLFLTYYLINIGNTYVDENRRVKLNVRKIARYMLYTVMGVFIIVILKSHNTLRYLLNAFLTSVVIAYVLNPLVAHFEKKYPKIKRKWWILIIFLVLMLIILFMMLSLLPRTIGEFTKLINNFPNYVDEAKAILIDLSYKHFGKDIFNLGDLKVKDIFEQIGLNKGNISSMLVGVKSTFSKIFVGILVPIFVYYLLDDKEKFIEMAKKMVPSKYREHALHLGRKMDKSVFKYVKGKILMAIYVGVVAGIFLGIFGVDFALVIGIITIFADIIPYIGPLFGFVPAVIFALLDSPTKAILVIFMFPFVQWTENNIVGPKIMSDQLGMHPLIVLVVTLAGGFLFGFVGMILALPFVIACEVIYDDYKSRKTDKKVKLK